MAASSSLQVFKFAVIALALFAAFGLSWYTYARREPPGRGRAALIAMRTAALVLIILLLVDPKLASAPRRSGGARVLLDASLSMGMGNAWQRGVADAARTRAPVLLFGTDVRTVSADSLAAVEPFAGGSRLLPALQSAAEAGADRVTLITDGGIEDSDDVARWLPTLGISLDIRNVGAAPRANRAIADVDAPAWAEAGKPVTLRLRVAARGGTRDRAIVVRQNGTIVGRTQADTVSFPANGPAEGGLVRYDVAFERADSIPDDDVRSIYIFVSEKPAGVAIVSFDPDWEPRFLHPVIEDALGLPVRTFLRVPTGIYLRGGGGLEAGGRVDEATVLRAVREADLLVLHGLSDDAPEWAQQAARATRRMIVFPAEAGIQQPVRTAASVAGDWYVAPELPASPISSLLAGIDASALPPLTSLQQTTIADAAWAPLLGGRTPRGGRSALVIAEERAGRRWVVALGRGYWRWAFRGGSAREAYTRLWAALAGWVVQDEAVVAGAAIRPVERAVARATAVRWLAPGIAADSLVLALRDARGRTSRARLVAERGDTMSSAPLQPGHYSYDVRAFSAGREVARSSGPLTMESYSPEFMRGRVDLDELKRAPAALAGANAAAGRPLHTYSWLYVLIVALLCAEWILRRRWGLR